MSKDNITPDELYKMKLHDVLTPSTGDYMPISIYILKVPGGWIYTMYQEEGISTTFVPFDNEFMEK